MYRPKKTAQPMESAAPTWFRKATIWGMAGGLLALAVLTILGWRWFTTPHLKVATVKEETNAILVTATEKRGLSREEALQLIEQARKRYPGKQQTTVEIYDSLDYAKARVDTPSAYPEEQYQQHRLASFFNDTKANTEQWELPKK